jgi:purine catabolism regulator
MPAARGLPTVAQVIALPELQRGRPQVVAGESGLGRAVRWVHVAEVPDIAPLLRGGELILTTGIALPADDAGLLGWVRELAAAGVSGVVVEGVRRFVDGLPTLLCQEADRLDLPLIQLAAETRFVQVTEAAHALILDSRTRLLEAAQRVHDIFTEYTVTGATPEQLVAEMARLADRAVVLETLTHQVVASATPPGLAEDPLDGWVRRSRRIAPAPRTEYDTGQGCLLTPVSAHGRTFGRLIMLDATDGDPILRTVLERGANAVAINHLAEHADWSAEAATHQALLQRILGRGLAGDRAPAAVDANEILLRTESIGIPLRGSPVVAVVVVLNCRGGEPPGQPIDGRRLVALAAQDAAVPALIGSLDDERVTLLVADSTPIAALAAAIHERLRPARAAIGVGPAVDGVREAANSLREAADVAAEVARAALPDRPFYRLADLRLRGLLRLLRDDAALAGFVERELGPLLVYDDAHGTDLVGTLKTFLRCGYNKAGTAAAAHLSRPTLYQRLHQIEHVLGIDLEDNESRLAVHVAALADDVVRG